VKNNTDKMKSTGGEEINKVAQKTLCH